MKILLVKTTSMGDVVHALPVVHDIKSRFPQAEIHWLVEASFAGIPQSCSAVDKVLTCQVRAWRKKLFAKETRIAVSALSSALKAERYDAVIDLQGLLKSVFLARMTGVAVSGYDAASIKEPLASRFYTHKFTVSRKLPAIDRCRSLAAQALGYEVPADAPNFGIDPAGRSGNTVLFFANTSRDTKLWPEAKWIELGKKVCALGMNILLPWGSEEERQRVGRLAQGIGAGATVPDRKSIREMIELIRTSRATVGLDTGMTHLSAAVGIPTVGIFRDYPIELVPLVGNGPKVGLGGVDCCPEVTEVYSALEKVIYVHSSSDL